MRVVIVHYLPFTHYIPLQYVACVNQQQDVTVLPEAKTDKFFMLAFAETGCLLS